MAFQIGDKVKYKNSYFTAFGTTGIVIGFADNIASHPLLEPGRRMLVCLEGKRAVVNSHEFYVVATPESDWQLNPPEVEVLKEQVAALEAKLAKAKAAL